MNSIIRRLRAGWLGAGLLACTIAHTGSPSPSPETLPSIPMNPAGFRLHRGTNLSHWLSQDFGWAPRDTFIVESDLRFIRRTGFDHVRLPVDEKELWHDDGTRNVAAFALLRQAIGWCRANDLRVIVDLHTVRAHHFDLVKGEGKTTLWTEPAAQKQFVGLWTDLSTQLGDQPVDAVAYEILNEPVADKPEDWNRLVAMTVAALRAREPNRVLLIGSNRWQNPATFPQLDVPAGDKNIILSVHTYAPLPFTHFRADWLATKDYSGPVHYPGRVVSPEDHARLMASADPALRALIANAAEEWNPDRLAKELEPAIQRARQLGLQLYCGEFGCLPTTPRADRLAYYRDLVSVLEAKGIAWANWEYKGDFGIYEWHGPKALGGAPDVELLDALLGRSALTPGPPLSARTKPEPPEKKSVDRKYRLLGVPLRAGSLVPGNENDPQAFREGNVVARLRALSCEVSDEGDIVLPTFLPHHHVAPIRNWPSPSIVWEAVSEKLLPLLQEPDNVPLLIGCDCSVVVGSARALAKVSSPSDLHIIYIDGDMDAAAPTAGKSQSAASLALWFLSQPSFFSVGPVVQPSQITVVGWSHATSAEQALGFGSWPLAEVERVGAREVAARLLAAIPVSATILLHFDVDVIADQRFSAAYFPHPAGLKIETVAELLGCLVSDPRIRVIEISEYAALRDRDGSSMNELIQILGAALKS